MRNSTKLNQLLKVYDIKLSKDGSMLKAELTDKMDTSKTYAEGHSFTVLMHNAYQPFKKLLKDAR